MLSDAGELAGPEAAVGELTRRYGADPDLAMLALTAFWLLVLVVLPYFLMVEFSLRPNLTSTRSADRRTSTRSRTTSPLFRQHGPLSASSSAPSGPARFVTALCLVVCYPIAFYLAKVAHPKNAPTLFLLLVIPFWINEILRTFAWFIILSYQGPLNAVLVALGLIDTARSAG